QVATADKDDDCHLAGATFDHERTALMGHSMGATVAPLALHLQPRYRAVVLSGANGSYIENILAKELPSPLAAQLEQLFGLDYCLDEFSLLSSLFQWAEEPSDPVVYEPALFADVVHPLAAGAKKRRPPDVLMIQGIGDHYIPPPVANVSSMGLRLSLVGPELDNDRPTRCTSDPEAAIPRCGGGARYPVAPVLPLLKYVGKGASPYPDHGPVLRPPHDDGIRGLVQYNRDASCRQDGHEVAYEIAQARWQYRCFLASFASGEAKIWPAPPHAVSDDTLEIDVPCPTP
ncbi:MAG TPA: alpha/beta hydrolase, partial [Polyangiaceae bacterium]|nr:alpha/beta hydrolase [Polyangiaceae bacterium]